MFKFRYKVETWEEYQDGINTYVKRIEEPVLQVRTMVNVAGFGIQEPIWSEWEDVPTEYIET